MSIEAALKNDSPIGFQDTYKKWRRMMFLANVVCASVIFIVEIVMFFVLRKQNLILQPLPVYMFYYMFLPTCCDLLIIVGGYCFTKIYKQNELILNYIPPVQLMLLCFVVCIVHNIFTVTLATFCAPIFLTILYGNYKMTRNITVASLILMLLSVRYGINFGDIEQVYLISETIVAMIIIFSMNIVCRILIQYQQEKNMIIEKGYRQQLMMREQLNLDQKTGLYGDTAFRNSLQKLVDMNYDGLGLGIFDIDDFKKVNDTYGHSYGDQVIICLSQIMKLLCQEQGYVAARFGGEEFAVIFGNGNLKEYLSFTEKLLLEFSKQRYEFSKELLVTISAGIAMWESGLNAEILFDRADKAMYVSKTSGKNCVTLWET